MAKPLPIPRTPSEVMLHDIATSLRQLSGRSVDDLDERRGQVRLQEPEPGVRIVNVGPAKKGSWHELTDGAGNVLERVRGKDNAEQRAAELAQQAA